VPTPFLQSGIAEVVRVKNQLTDNFFGSIMHTGAVLVLKWYFYFVASDACAGLQWLYQGCAGTVHVVGGRL
jgi:hypothetical protein